MAERVVGLGFAAVSAVGLYYLWLEIAPLVRSTWLGDLSLVFTVIYVFAALWLLEKIWDAGPKRLFERRDH